MFESVKLVGSTFVAKFKNSPTTSSITDDKFAIYSIVDPPIKQDGALKPIDLSVDYDSISRTLYLRIVSGVLVDATSYDLVASGVKSSAGTIMPTYTHRFTYTAAGAEDPVAPSPTPTVVDHSIIADAFVSSQIVDGNANPDFHVIRTEPTNGSLFVDTSTHPRGMITVVFNRRPAVGDVTSEYFKVQRKQITNTASTRWENVSTQMVLDTHYPKVYLYLPSTDTVPVYAESGREYYEDGYKYRVRVLRGLSA